jgi:hypothetical protein
MYESHVNRSFTRPSSTLTKEEMEFPGFTKIESSPGNKNRSIAVSKKGQSFLLEGKDKVEIECLRGHIIVDIDTVGDHSYKALTKEGGLILLRCVWSQLFL